MPKKLHVDDCSRKPKYKFSFSAANYCLKLHKKHSIIKVQRMESNDFTRHYIIRYLNACELVLPPALDSSGSWQWPTSFCHGVGLHPIPVKLS